MRRKTLFRVDADFQFQLSISQIYEGKTADLQIEISWKDQTTGCIFSFHFIIHGKRKTKWIISELPVIVLTTSVQLDKNTTNNWGLTLRLCKYKSVWNTCARVPYCVCQGKVWGEEKERKEKKALAVLIPAPQCITSANNKTNITISHLAQMRENESTKKRWR